MNKMSRLLSGRKKALWLIAAGLCLAPADIQALPSGIFRNETPVSVTGNLRVQQINPTTVELVYADGKCLTIDFYSDGIFRMFRDDQGGILRAPEATPPAQILTDQPRRQTGEIHASIEGNSAIIESPCISICINGASGLMTVKEKASGKVLLEEAAQLQADKDKTILTFKIHDHEYFYGGGVQNGRFSHLGQSIAIENTNNWVDGGVASPTPFYWSTAGYGLLWHTFRPGMYDFGETEAGKAILSHNTDYLDVFIMTGKDAVELLNGYYQLTGHPVLLPKFAFYEGHLNAYNRDYWTEDSTGTMPFEDGKYYKESQKDNGGIKESLNGEKGNYQFSARAVVDRYAAHDMPLGWILPNDGYGAGYGQDSTLDGNIRNLKAFGDYARSHGVEIGLWTQSDLHPKEGIEALLQRDIVKEVRDAGVRVLKTDVAWVGAGYSFGLNGVADVGHIMPYYGNNARPFIISLDGWAGTQRYAGVWSGDQTGGDWEYIRFHIPTYIGSGLSGIPNITSDMDGIFGGKNLPVNVRDFQWKTFTPMQLNMDGWGSNPKYPQALGEPATSINRWYLKMKSELLPYTYSIAHEAIQGLPLIRAMFLEYPNAYTLGTATRYQFLYGPYFLVAPIYQNTDMDKEGNDIRDGIYLPEGEWIDYFNGDLYTGNCILNNFQAPLWKLPVFVKSAAIIPITVPNNQPDKIPADYRAYEIYGRGNTVFTEYDDDGKTQAYLDKAYTQTRIESRLEGDRLTVTIHPTTGSFNGFCKDKVTEFRINVTEQPKHIVLKTGNRNVKLREATTLEDFAQSDNAYFYCEAPELNRFATPGSAFAEKRIAKNPQLLVKASVTDITTNGVSLRLDGFCFEPTDHLHVSTGSLSAPKWQTPEENIEAYTLIPQWEKIDNADYYEIEFNGMLYTTIRNCSLAFNELTPETEYHFKLRAVNANGTSEWAETTLKTIANPLEYALQGIRAQTTCDAEPGSGIQKLFDFDEKTMWHTVWGRNSLPFDMTLDLGSVNELDKLVYLPRKDAGNGTLTAGSISYSTDKQNWSTPIPFQWERNATAKTFIFADTPKARYIRLNITEGVGGFGSGSELYVFKVPGTASILQGDINKDNRIDENDLTSYMNYTGLRAGDSDFEYISDGDINRNGLIDAYDISAIGTILNGGVNPRADAKATGSISIESNRQSFNTGDTIRIRVSGKGLKNVNAMSFALPYDSQLIEYVGMEIKDMKEMVNYTRDRLHTNGDRALYPTFFNLGNNWQLEGDGELFTLLFKAKRQGSYVPKVRDGMLVDRNMTIAPF